MKELKPCPFCGSKNIKLYNITGLKMIGCRECCAKSSLFPTTEEAAEAWNRRADIGGDDHAAD